VKFPDKIFLQNFLQRFKPFSVKQAPVTICLNKQVIVSCFLWKNYRAAADKKEQAGFAVH
jgi:hypothetical protein